MFALMPPLGISLESVCTIITLTLLPQCKFDQSGRATEGLAFVSYENESHANAAMKAFNGAPAKGTSPKNVGS